MKNQEQKNDNLLEQIKRLLILSLIHQGVTGKDIAYVLGVDPAVISRMTPPKSKKK
ncbi:hypothetical protein KC866_03870 [Patescibacteria group bacterium]|nr:hypothetical protein [Patescibacteria group bacterium]